jgi:hypothetical protein
MLLWGMGNGRKQNTWPGFSDVYKSIPDPDVVDLNWYPLITTLYKKLLDGDCFYTKRGGGKWIKQSESLSFFIDFSFRN